MDSTDLHQLLMPGERLGEPGPIELGGIRSTYGYQVYPVIDVEDAGDSNAVLLDIRPGGSTELEHTLRDGQVLAVEARRGIGELVVYTAAGERRIHDLAPNLGAVAINAGDTYRYLNTGGYDDYLTVFDRSRPAWLPEDEIQLEEVDSLDGLQEGDFIVVWNQREPGRAYSAGALRIEVLEEHDTTKENLTRADQAKYQGVEPHWHALAKKAGESETRPVNLSFGDGWISVRPRKTVRHETITPGPSFFVQPEPYRKLFKSPRT